MNDAVGPYSDGTTLPNGSGVSRAEQLASAPMSRPILIAPSVLPADFARLGEEVAALEAAGCDRIQFDVMDGQFVPNLTFGPDVIAALRPHATIPFEAHLMVLTPDAMAANYVQAGCERLILHAEACPHLHRSLANVAALGAKASVALNPATPASAVAHVLDLIDMVLVMTVNPGFGGQQYIATMEPKIREVAAMIAAAGLSDQVDIEVDGGISPSTIAGAAAAGANVLVAGSALYRDPLGLAHAVTELRSLAEAARS
jgi:ribulose-phosphate 3-epimerase